MTAPTRTAKNRRVEQRPIAEINGQTEVGAIYVHALRRSQLRLALTVLFALACSVMAFAVLFALAPALTAHTVFSVPVSWILLLTGLPAIMAGLGRFYVRRAEINERRFVRMVNR